jgi:hypothetical protein
MPGVASIEEGAGVGGITEAAVPQEMSH